MAHVLLEHHRCLFGVNTLRQCIDVCSGKRQDSPVFMFAHLALTASVGAEMLVKSELSVHTIMLRPTLKHRCASSLDSCDRPSPPSSSRHHLVAVSMWDAPRRYSIVVLLCSCPSVAALVGVFKTILP
ncbi:hypothetical protein P153DRAFT_148886 [Dothidotthia symphoricarpi CBS 119687]|uniref:Uncharacterized protein n=1 Tax=Dothidotthia symphoricarpi CBS 119687 TaxID=1392245 RepID=A0A6A5ZXD7_9PLEO|nr:uncharacterized protein P153DRAFT_148886 [Dothidotthia symphoricarpi CBS 119687]KAF2123563.1 hypothetical protein P153DRAFT_148886 [Dothidotthia symphoricarpi CBS 119687]